MDTEVDRLMRDVAGDMGKSDSYNRAPVGVYFGEPGVEADDPYFGGEGPRCTGCISCGNCMIGCGNNAKNKFTVNYLYLAEKHGARVHELHEVYELKPLEGGGFEVHVRHPGWAHRAIHLQHKTYTAEQVIVSAHAYGSSKLRHHMKHKGTLPGLSDQLGQRARTKSASSDSTQRRTTSSPNTPTETVQKSAGRQGEETDMNTTIAEFRILDEAPNLPDNYVNPYYLQDLKRTVAVARVNGELYAFDNLCPHEACPLSAGLLTGNVLMCQCHGSQFDVTTGGLLRGPATKPLTTYEVREQDGKIDVRV